MPARLQFTEALQKEESALKQASRNGAKLPEISIALREYWHDKSLHRVPDAVDRKNIKELFAGQNTPDAIGAALELHTYRVLETMAELGKIPRDPRN
jgi:hypothetical protein